jgi:excisionase family DNA binding protein
MTTDPLLTKDEAAELLNVAVRFVDRCVVERRIRYVKWGDTSASHGPRSTSTSPPPP